jgi:hypothetical protein
VRGGWRRASHRREFCHDCHGFCHGCHGCHEFRCGCRGLLSRRLSRILSRNFLKRFLTCQTCHSFFASKGATFFVAHVPARTLWAANSSSGN